MCQGDISGLTSVFGNNIADKGKTLGPAFSPGTKVTPHTVRVTRKLQQHSCSSLLHDIVSALNMKTSTET